MANQNTEGPADEATTQLVRDFLAVLEERNVEKTVAFLTDDATWVTPAATYKGKQVIRRYLSWEFKTVPVLSVTETGVGLMVAGNRAIIEHQLTGMIRGKSCTWLAMCAYEFRDDKIRKLRTVYDRLSLAQETASGWLQRTIVNAVASQTESGVQ